MFAEGLRTHGEIGWLKAEWPVASDPYYYGKCYGTARFTRASMEPLITKELYDRVRDVLRLNYAPAD